MINVEFEKLMKENSSLDSTCNLCNEVNLNIGESSKYGAVVIYKIGDIENGWFATLSPKTGGDIKKDFTIQLMSLKHITHFSQINNDLELAKNYGVAFAQINEAMTRVMSEESEFKAISKDREVSCSIATYGKCTTWGEKKEHVHIKLFPFRGKLGQPSTVDSSFGRKEVFSDKTGKKFIKMDPIEKEMIEKNRFEYLTQRFIKLLK